MQFCYVPAIAFPYPSILALELCFLIIGGPILEYARLYFGRRGNLTEKGWPLILFLIFCIPTIFAHVYFIAWQAYVSVFAQLFLRVHSLFRLQIELPLNIISFVFLAFEMVFAVVYFVIFQRKSSL